MRLPLLLGVSILALSVHGAALAQNGQPHVPVPLQGAPSAETTGERMSRYWANARGLFSLSFGSGGLNMARPSPRSDTEDFRLLMDLAGFKLKHIESRFGIVPGLSLEFGLARELSDSDLDYVSRSLARHARNNPGPVSLVQRLIVEGVLEAAHVHELGMEKVEITLLPFPHVTFTLAPREAPTGSEASQILRAIERLNERLVSGGSRTRASDPSAPPAPHLRAPSL